MKLYCSQLGDVAKHLTTSLLSLHVSTTPCMQGSGCFAHQAPLGVVLSQDGTEVIACAGDHDASAGCVGHPGPLRALRPEGLLLARRTGARSS